MAMRALSTTILPAVLTSLLCGCTTVAEPPIALPGFTQPQLQARSKPILEREGLQFRDLDGDGMLSPFEDWRLSDAARADDLVTRMTLAEKVGALMHSTLPGKDGELGRAASYDHKALASLVRDRHVTSFITRLATPPSDLAQENNAAQEVAESARIAIPLTISTDPRNHFQYVLGASESADGTTKWPEMLGFAALGDAARVRQFGDVARREYRAVGIHMALSPQLDLVTEPRWSRSTGTFGSDAQTASALGGAYIAGFQGGADGLQPDGVMAVAKHWVGYGAQPDGFDAHNYYGRFARPGPAFDDHITAFQGALDAGVAGIMPAYPILVDTKLDGVAVEPVAPGFNRQLLQTLLREEKGFDGIILSDWAITRDCDERCRAPTADAPQRPQDIATSWGVAELSVAERYVKGLSAGIDQFGGTDEVDPLIEAVQQGAVDEARLNQSVRRVMMTKFRLGLFENPYVDPEMAARVVGNSADVALARRTQREAQVLLQNGGSSMPFNPGSKVWLFGMDSEAAIAAGLVPVDRPEDADFAVIRTETASEMLHPHSFFGSRQKEGRLDFRPGDPAYDALLKASEVTPTVLAIFLDRPAILTNVQDKASVILGNFGADDAAVLDVLLGRAKALGRLPFELPSSMAAVEAQDPAMPDDSPNPLYRRGAGL